MNRYRERKLWVLAAAGATVGASTLWAAGGRDRPTRAEDVTITGKLVDLQTYMTGRSMDRDPEKSTQQCIRSGVPAALETEEGLVVIGMGERGPSRLLVPLALKEVELKGKLYEKEGLQYIDITSARAAPEETEEAEHAETAEPVEHADPADQGEPEESEEETPDEVP